jgi:hypothetical protein
MDFAEEFDAWLANALKHPVSSTVVAFSLNLYELGLPDTKFGIELIGAGKFDAEDSDWACDEVWVSEPRGLAIPATFSGDSWEACLRVMRCLILESLSKPTVATARLKASNAVALGFVDGDLDIIWRL